MDVPRATRTIAAPIRRLRLSELLDEVRSKFEEAPTRSTTTEASAPEDAAASAPADANTGTDDADTPAAAEPRLTMGALVDHGGDASFGFLIGVLVLIAIPFFGLSTPFGLAIATVGSQMVMGRPRPWLPRRARRRELSGRMIERITSMLARRTRWIVRATRPRWSAMIQPRLIGAGVVILALGLALPLPIPGSNWVFLFPLFVYAIGILERDGAWIVIGHVLTVIDLALLVVFWRVVWMVLVGVWRWFT